MSKNHQQHIIELTVKQLSKPELCSVKTTILPQYIIHEAKTSVSEKIRDPKKTMEFEAKVAAVKTLTELLQQ